MTRGVVSCGVARNRQHEHILTKRRGEVVEHELVQRVKKLIHKGGRVLMTGVVMAPLVVQRLLKLATRRVDAELAVFIVIFAR